jgi:hypothetical protein
MRNMTMWMKHQSGQRTMNCCDGRGGGGFYDCSLVCGRDHRARGFAGPTTHDDKSQPPMTKTRLNRNGAAVARPSTSCYRRMHNSVVLVISIRDVLVVGRPAADIMFTYGVAAPLLKNAWEGQRATSHDGVAGVRKFTFIPNADVL